MNAMTFAKLKKGDILSAWCDTGCMGSTLLFFRVHRTPTGRRFVTFETEHGRIYRKAWWFFHEVLPEPRARAIEAEYFDKQKATPA